MDEHVLLQHCVDNCKEFQRLAEEAEHMIRCGLKGELAQRLHNINQSQKEEMNEIINNLLLLT